MMCIDTFATLAALYVSGADKKGGMPLLAVGAVMCTEAGTVWNTATVTAFETVQLSGELTRTYRAKGHQREASFK